VPEPEELVEEVVETLPHLEQPRDDQLGLF
jgi:hypothetical protein